MIALALVGQEELDIKRFQSSLIERQRTFDIADLHLCSRRYGIALRLEQISDRVFRVNPGSLFPAFRRLERAGWIKAEWKPTENNRRAKYYALTGEGRSKLKSETREWEKQTIARILEAT